MRNWKSGGMEEVLYKIEHWKQCAANRLGMKQNRCPIITDFLDSEKLQYYYSRDKIYIRNVLNLFCVFEVLIKHFLVEMRFPSN